MEFTFTELKQLSLLIDETKPFDRKKYFNNKTILYLSENCAVCKYSLVNDSNKCIIIKKKKNSASVENSCNITKSVLNKFYVKLPYFRYTIGSELLLFHHRRNIYQEYIKGFSFQNFFYSKYYTIELFQNLFLQLILMLEISQEQLNFTHYDLHLNNILITKVDRKNIKEFEFVLFNKEKIYVKNLGFTIKIIDFDYTVCVKYRQGFSQRKLRKYGYIGIFLAGVDLLRFLFSIKFFITHISNDEEKHSYVSLEHFVDLIFEKVYSISFSDHTALQSSLKLHRKMYFFMLHTKKIYVTPLQILSFLQNEKLFMTTTGLTDDTSKNFVLQDIYIPSLHSSREAILFFIHQFQNIQVNSIEDVYIHRIVLTLQNLLHQYQTVDFIFPKKLKDVVYLNNCL